MPDTKTVCAPMASQDTAPRVPPAAKSLAAASGRNFADEFDVVMNAFSSVETMIRTLDYAQLLDHSEMKVEIMLGAAMFREIADRTAAFRVEINALLNAQIACHVGVQAS